MQAEVEAHYNLSFVYDIYGRSPEKELAQSSCIVYHLIEGLGFNPA
jgi:hypothetical protein